MFVAFLCNTPVVTEVCSNPVNETTGEFVELYNDSTGSLDVSGYTVTDGDALDDILPWTAPFPQGDVVTGTTVVPPEGFAVLLEEDYPLDPWLVFPAGTVILTTGDHSICNGLAAASDPLTLYLPSGTTQANAVSSFGTPFKSDDWHNCDDDGLDSIPFNPGEAQSLGRYPLSGADCEANWYAGEPTPGLPTDTPPDTFAITVDSLFLSQADPAPGSTVQLTALVSCRGTVSPDSGQVVVFIDANGDSVAQWEEILLTCPAGNLNPGETDTLQVLFTAPATGWYPAVCSAPGTSARVHFSTGGGVNPVITEVMANPLNEDQEEFIEIFYRGPGVFPLAGCSFTDGDAVDIAVALDGPRYIAAGQTALILDPEYQNTLEIPPGTPIFTPANTTLGNGLTTDDPVLLYLPGDPSLSLLLSTSGTPLLYDDPLMCDDDGLDSIPFNPGDGCSMQRVTSEGPDAEFNWIASPPGGTPGVFEENQGWTDLSTDSIWIGSAVSAVFSNCGSLDAQGFCTFFFDLDGDLQPSAGETVHQCTVTLAAGESDTVTAVVSLPDSGLFVAAATIQNPADTVVSNNTQHCLLLPDNPAWPVITEVLCNPSNQDCDEFVELFFPGPGLADLCSFLVTDNDSRDNLIPETTAFLTPGGYALILDPEYTSGSMPYDIPEETVILYPANTTIGDGLSGNDPVLLVFDTLCVSTYGTPGNPTDSIPYNPGTDLSVERILPGLPDQENSWLTSPWGPTPGAPPEAVTEGVDYAIVSASVSPPMGEENTQATVEVKLTSAGTDTVSQGSLTVRISVDGDEICSFSPPPPTLGDTLALHTVWQGTAEQSPVTGKLECTSDVNPSNNTSSAVWNPPATVCINEVFYSETEWLELFNCTQNVVSLTGFTVSDPSTSSPLPDEQLAPSEYIVLTADQDEFQNRWGSVTCPVFELDQWPALNNSGDTLTLMDGSQVVDMVPYTSQWGGNSGASLERRSCNVYGFIENNWGTSVCCGTPGAENSIGTVSSGEFLTLVPTVFNPPDTPLRIEVNLPMQACNVTVKVFDVRGMQIEKLYSSISPGELLVLEWSGNSFPVGRYIVFAEAVCAGEIISDAQVVVLARQLN